MTGPCFALHSMEIELERLVIPMEQGEGISSPHQRFAAVDGRFTVPLDLIVQSRV